MNLPRYELKAEKSLMVFEFTSEGPKGQIPKIVKFSETNLKDVFNIAFGDKSGDLSEMDDTSISNNGDSEKVLSSVVATIYAFTDKYPDCWVYATGSTRARTRLYRIGITKYLADVKKDFEIYGLRGNTWELFEKRINYEAFLARRKK